MRALGIAMKEHVLEQQAEFSRASLVPPSLNVSGAILLPPKVKPPLENKTVHNTVCIRHRLSTVFYT